MSVTDRCTATDPIWHLRCERANGHGGDHDNVRTEWSGPMNALDAIRRATRHNEAVDNAARQSLVSPETIAEAAAMEERDRLAGGFPWEVPDHPDHGLPGGWHRNLGRLA